MNTDIQNPFAAQSPWEWNACVNNYLQYAELGDYCFSSADVLAQAAVDDHSTLDVHVYAICFLYRHGIELHLKDLFWKSNYITCGTKQIPKHHKLLSLWSDLLPCVRGFAGTDFPLNPREVASVRGLLKRIEEHDPGSDSFRYPYNKREQRSHPNLSNVNLVILHKAVHEAISHLNKLAYTVDYHYGSRSQQNA